jgi:2,4-dienoyl-CoA reductase-like NADH-dependent reductase (Old Yellow Enzyme family)
LPSRIVRAAHGTRLTLGPELAAYHAGPARSGVGLTVLETAAVHPTSTGSVRAYDDGFVPAYRSMLEELHQYPMKLFQQLWHSGRTFNPPDGGPPWSASDLPGPRVAQTDLAARPIGITRRQIDEIVDSFATAAGRVVAAGVDGVEIHSAHGYFLGQFLSPLSNIREDEYGGSLENRMRLLTRILVAVRDVIGNATPIGIRISANEMVPGGLSTEEAAAVSKSLDEAGLIDFLDVSLGSPMNYTKVIGGMEEPLGYELDYSLVLAAAVSVPTIVGGRVTSLAQAEEILREGSAQLVSMVRAHIADPDLMAKSIGGHADRVRPCIGCNQGCVGAAASPGGRFGCTVNPTAASELIEAGLPSARPRTTLVVGAGPAGLEAARVAAERGDTVILCEATQRFGGQLDLARRAPGREEMGRIVDWLVHEVVQLGVEVRMGVTVDADYALRLGADRVIIATGSCPRIDGGQISEPYGQVPGIDLPLVLTSWELIDGAKPSSDRIVVFDDVGHFEAISAAEVALERGYEVILASRLNRPAPLLEAARLETIIKGRLFPKRLEFLPDRRLKSVQSNSVTLESLYGAPDRVVEGTSLVLVGANVPRQGLADELDGRLPAELVGDAWGPRFLQLAIAEGHRAAMRA